MRMWDSCCILGDTGRRYIHALGNIFHGLLPGKLIQRTECHTVRDLVILREQSTFLVETFLTAGAAVSPLSVVPVDVPALYGKIPYLLYPVIMDFVCQRATPRTDLCFPCLLDLQKYGV